MTYEKSGARIAVATGFDEERFDYGEERYKLFGMVEGRLLVVAFTKRDETIRIIIRARRGRP